jgi:hypothetical protein
MRIALALIVAVAFVAACDDRLDPLNGGFRRPPIEVKTQAGDFALVEVNDSVLPHETENSKTIYSLVSATFKLSADSNWEYSTLEVVRGTNGVVLGNSPANYAGTWRVVDSTITLLPSQYGTLKLKGDTVFWRGAPKHGWEDTLTLTLVRK